MTAPTLVGGAVSVSATTSGDPGASATLQADDVLIGGFFADIGTVETMVFKKSAGTSFTDEDETVTTTGATTYSDGTSGTVAYDATSTQANILVRYWSTHITGVSGSPTASNTVTHTSSRFSWVGVLRPVSGKVPPARSTRLVSTTEIKGWPGADGAKTISFTPFSGQCAVVIACDITNTTTTLSCSDGTGSPPTDLMTPSGFNGYHLFIGLYDAGACPSSVTITNTGVWGNTNNSITVTVLAMETPHTDWSKTFTDPVGITDTMQAGGQQVKTITDHVGITDVVPRAWSQTITDAVTVTDTATLSNGKLEAVGITDSLTFVRTSSITVTDRVGITDVAHVDTTPDKSQRRIVLNQDTRLVLDQLSRLVLEN